MEEPDFWEDTEGSQKVMKELKMLKDTIQTAEELNRQFEDTDTLLEMAEEEEDASLAGEIREGIRENPVFTCLWRMICFACSDLRN